MGLIDEMKKKRGDKELIRLAKALNTFTAKSASDPEVSPYSLTGIEILIDEFMRSPYAEEGVKELLHHAMERLEIAKLSMLALTLAVSSGDEDAAASMKRQVDELQITGKMLSDFATAMEKAPAEIQEEIQRMKGTLH